MQVPVNTHDASAFYDIPYSVVKLAFVRHVSGIEGAFDGQGAKTVIPRKVIGKFSIRIVPDMQPDEVEKLVIDYLEKRHKEFGSPNTLK